MTKYTDINFNFLSRVTPQKWKPYILLARLDRPIGSWLLFLPCLWAILLASNEITTSNIVILLYFGLGSIIMRSAGCVINDLWDRNIDKKVERTKRRPLASGKLSVKQAVIFLGFLLSAGFIVLLQMNIFTIILGICSVFMIIIYPLMKRFTYWPQAFLGITFNWGALMGTSAIIGTINWTAILIYIGGIFWTLAYDTIYAHQDKKDDLLSGIKSSAIALGDKSRLWVSIFYCFSIIFFTLAGYSSGGELLFYLAMILPISYIVWQIKIWDPNDQKNSLIIFKSNRNFGVLLAFSYILGMGLI